MKREERGMVDMLASDDLEEVTIFGKEPVGRTKVIVPVCKGQGEITKCKNYRGISLVNVADKTNELVLVQRILRENDRVTDDDYWERGDSE